MRNYIKKHILKAHSWLAAGLLLTAASAFAAGGWGVIARIVDDKGNPVMGVGYQTEKPEDFR